MKRLAVCVLLLAALLCLTACGQDDAPAPTEVPAPTEAPAPASTPEPVPALTPEPAGQPEQPLEIGLEVTDTVFYTSDYAGGCLYMAAEVQKTGDVLLVIDGGASSFDMFDAEGHLLCHVDGLTATPTVLGAVPGEDCGYLAATVLEDSFDLSACAEVRANVVWDTATAVSFNIWYEDLTVKEYSGPNFYAFQGLLVNDNAFDVYDVTPYIVFHTQDGDFAGVHIGETVDVVPGGGSIGTAGEPQEPIPWGALGEDPLSGYNLMETAVYVGEPLF